MAKYFKFGLTKSKMEKFLRCGFGYDQHYNKKCRPVKDSSALMMGIACDDMFNHLILGGTVEECMVIFKKRISKYELGSVTVGKKDYDKFIIPNERREKAQGFLLKKFKVKYNIDDVFNTLFNKDKLSKQEEKIIDYIARVSLISKAEIMLDAYNEQIIPRIFKVHSVQKSSEVGILDLDADWEKKGNRYIIDNKTAGKVYEEKAADYALQLVQYAIEEKCNKIMLIVIPKTIQRNTTKTCKKCKYVANSTHITCNNEVDTKRCHGDWDVVTDFYIDIQVITAKVTKKMKERTKEIKVGIQKQIDSGTFVCNFASCDSQFGRPCIYRELYWKGNMNGLEVKK